MPSLIEGERRLKRYKITTESGGYVVVSSAECKVYEEDGEVDEEGNPIILDTLPTEIINNGTPSVIIESLFDTVSDEIDPNKTYKARLTIVIGEEIYIEDQLISITE
jgi:hypothetical protein